MIKSLAFLTFTLTSLLVSAEEERSLASSPRGNLMGGAYTSLADDDFTLFYNPAVLARHSGFSFYPINPSFSVVNILDEPNRFEDIGETPVEVATVTFDFPVHVGVDYAPGFKMGRFGLSALVNNQTNFNLQNKVTPVLDIDHRFDRGFIMGYAHPLFGNYKTGGSGEHLALGTSLKYIQRESIYNSFNLTGLSLLDTLSNSDDPDLLLEGLGKAMGRGWGFDLGLDYVNSSGTQTFAMGLALLDIYTILHTDSNPDDFEVQTQPMRIHFGSSYKLSAPGGFDMTLSADIKNLQDEMELMRRVHLGFELNLTPVVSALVGVNAVDNYSYGAKLNLGLVKAFFGVYETEIGEKLQQQDSSRFLLYVSLLHFDFEP